MAVTSADATARVAGVEVSTDHFIGGDRVPSAARFEVISPIDGAVIAHVARGGEKEVDRAVRAAREAFEPWAELGPAGRAQHLHRLADLVVADEERDWRSNGTWNRVQRMPAGPAGIVTPWNAPFMLSTWKAAPALAAGDTMVLKPAEWSPLSCSLLADLIGEAGFPPGVFNIVQGIGEEAGAALVSHPLLKRISFTGSPETGRHIAGAAAS